MHAHDWRKFAYKQMPQAHSMKKIIKTNTVKTKNTLNYF